MYVGQISNLGDRHPGIAHKAGKGICRAAKTGQPHTSRLHQAETPFYFTVYLITLFFYFSRRLYMKR